MLGVATAGANLDCFLGQGSDSWGLSTNKDLFACGKKIKSDYGHKLSRTGEIKCRVFTVYYCSLSCDLLSCVTVGEYLNKIVLCLK
jgi:hypothetical protein